MRRFQKKHLFRAAVAGALTLAVVLSSVLIGGAVWDEATAVHIVPADIEPSTLVVGTHLIHLSALTDSIYDVAEQSAEESGQTSVYYKSELAGGAWFDITSATTLEDITTGGTPVLDGVIAELFFTHHTKSDGVTYDLRTGLAVDPRDIYNPYDLESMEELFPLKTHYDLLRETQSGSKAGKAKIARAAEFFATSVITDETIEIDTELAALQVYYDVLNDHDGGAAEKNEVQSVMDAVDASRRAKVFAIVEEALATYLEELSTVSDSQDEAGNVSEGSMPDTNLQSAVSDSLNNVRASRISCEGKMLDPGTTVTTDLRYAYSRSLVDHAVARVHDACDGDVENLLTLNDIVDGVYADLESELAMLDGVLLPRGTAAYTGGLSAGQNADYNTALAQHAADVLLRSIAQDNTSLLNAYRNELEFFITAWTERQSADAGGTYLDGRLVLAQGWYTLPPSDAFRDGAGTTVDAHIEFLTRLKRSLELSAGGNELDALVMEKSDLQRDMMACLDDNDLTGAKTLEDQIAALDAQIQTLSGQSLDELADLNDQLTQAQQALSEARDAGDEAAAAGLEGEVGALKGRIAALGSGMTDGTLGAQVAKLKSDALAAIADGDGEGAMSGIEALTGLLGQDYGVVFPALKDLHGAMAREKELSGSRAFDGGLNAVEDAILNNADAYAAAMRTEHTADDLTQIAEDFFAANAGSGGLLSANVGTGSLGAGGGSGSGTGGAGAGTGTGPGTGGSAGTTPGSGAGASIGDYVGPASTGQGTAAGPGQGGQPGQSGTSGTPNGAGEGSSTGGDGTGGEGPNGAGGTGDGSGGQGSPSGQSGQGGTAGTPGGVTGGDVPIGGSGTAGGADLRPTGDRVGSGELTLSLSGDPIVNLIALEMYYTETGSQEAAALLQSLALQEMGVGNPLVFQRVDDAGREYLPLTALRSYTGMRYVWNRNLSQGTLARGGVYYGFTAYSDQVKRSQNSADTDAMAVASKYQNGVLHVHESYTYQAFGVEAVYLSGTHYGVLCDSALMEAALALFSAFLA